MFIIPDQKHPKTHSILRILRALESFWSEIRRRYWFRDKKRSTSELALLALPSTASADAAAPRPPAPSRSVIASLRRIRFAAAPELPQWPALAEVQLREARTRPSSGYQAPSLEPGRRWQGCSVVRARQVGQNRLRERRRRGRVRLLRPQDSKGSRLMRAEGASVSLSATPRSATTPPKARAGCEKCRM